MAQHDYVIDNQTAPNFRADLNNALAAIVSTNSGTSAPSTTYANMLWYDTTNNILKMRNEADDTWINVAYLDQTANAFRILDDTQVVNTSGTQTGLLGDQSTATWEGGTGTTESLVSPAKVRAVIPAALNASGSAPIYACRAWVNFNGTGTVAIRASGNVSSITDNGVGDYTVNFTTAMSDADYCADISFERDTTSQVNVRTCSGYTGGRTTSSFRLVTEYSAGSGAAVDMPAVYLSIFR
jgi:hypothetical protein